MLHPLHPCIKDTTEFDRTKEGNSEEQVQGKSCVSRGRKNRQAG